MVIAEISVVPVGTGTTSEREAVQAALDALGGLEGLKVEVTALGTIVEGNWPQVMEAVRRMHEAPFQTGVQRLMTSIRLDDRRDKQESMEEMVGVVQAPHPKAA